MSKPTEDTAASSAAAAERLVAKAAGKAIKMHTIEMSNGRSWKTDNKAVADACRKKMADIEQGFVLVTRGGVEAPYPTTRMKRGNHPVKVS